MDLATIGYEGMDIHEFIDILEFNCVQTLIDIREIPLSRKPGFSKGALALALGKAGIDYLHLQKLGSPKAIRDAYKRSGDWLEFARQYRAYLNLQMDVMESLAMQVEKSKCCLLCFEKDAACCHRSLVVIRLKRMMDIEVVHLKLEDPRPVVRPCLSLALV